MAGIVARVQEALFADDSPVTLVYLASGAVCLSSCINP